jgi:hypothetical protein
MIRYSYEREEDSEAKTSFLGPNISGNISSLGIGDQFAANMIYELRKLEHQDCLLIAEFAISSEPGASSGRQDSRFPCRNIENAE